MHRSRKELLDLLRARGCPVGKAPDEATRAEQLRRVAERAGGVNRLAVLLRFHKDLHHRQQSRLDPSDN